ncbi:MAG: HNH endonuclease [Methanobacterium sp. Maddingley MBC34]|nr:MAG: HNH endonuclease [Methanobacterium sp. Maddingley MBC34]
MRLIYQNRGSVATIVLALPDPLAGLVKRFKPPKQPKKQRRGKAKPSTNYQRFRMDVLERCNHRCVACGETNKRLVVHHLNSYAVFDDLTLDPDNGVALCHDCDQGFHSAYGIVGNTRSQFMEWVNSK